LLALLNYSGALRHADHMIAKNMRRTSALAFICMALGELGRLDELNALANHDRLISAD